MAGALKKTMSWFGFGDEVAAEPEYVDEYAEPAAEVTPLHGDTHLRRITTVHPRSYNDARAIGEAFRAGTPVIINLTDMSESDAKRLVDFSAGLIFGLHGAIERVTNKVFLLSPAHVEIAGEEPDTGVRAGFYNQS